MRKEEEKMSKIKLKIGNIGRGNKKVFAAIAISALVMVAAITIITSTQAQQPVPHAIYGYVRYANNSAVENATVIITVINGSNSSDIRGTLMNTTDNTGYYSVDLGNLPVEWADGDNITAYAYIVIGNNTFGGDNYTIADNTTTQQWLNITINEPSTIKTIGDPKCLEGFYVTNETEFNLTATPAPGSDVIVTTYYRLWYNGAWTLWTEYDGNFTLDMGEGLYYIEFYSEAYNSTLDEYYDEHVHKQRHFVDDIPPTTYAEFGLPVAPVTGPNGMPIIGPDTPLWINASEYDTPINGSGVREIHYMIYRNMTAPENWELVEEKSVYFDNVTNASVELTFDSGCYYEVRWYAVDCLGNKADLHHVQFAVDVKNPSIHLDIGTPQYYDNETNRLWVNCSTPIWVNVTDSGCGGIKAGVKQLIINVSWNETTGNVFEHNYVIVVNDGGANDSDGVADGQIHYKFHFTEECYHEPEFRAIDYVNNTFAFKKEFFVDCEPPWIEKTIPKIAFINQDEMDSAVAVNDTSNDDWQSFIANWSYVDAINVSICGDFYGYGIKAQIYDQSQTTVVGETETKHFEGSYCGWLQLHLKNRTYLEHGKIYWLHLVSDGGPGFYWNVSTNNPLNLVYAIANGTPQYNWDFAFKLEYYPFVGNTVFHEDFEEPWVPDSDGDLAPPGWEVNITDHGNNDHGVNDTFYWSQYDNSMYAYYDGTPSTALVQNGEYCAGVWWNSSTQNEWLVSPEISLPDYPVSLKFWSLYYLPSYASSDFHNYVKISTDGGTTWTNLADLTQDSTYQQGGDDVNWPSFNHYEVPVTIDLSAYAGQTIKLAWVYYAPTGGNGIWMVDNVTVTTSGVSLVYDPDVLYTFYNHTISWDGLNNTWITSKAFFHIASDDEGCMGGVGLKSLQYRIWNESNGWGPWINYTGPFNISEECKHYIQIKATDLLNQTRITNQTHYVDNSPPELIPPWKIFDEGKHGWFNDSGIYRMRAGYGIWFNFTDMPECNPVGFRSATLYWRYTYTNFTMPVAEEHPANGSDTGGDFTINVPYSIVYKDGEYWYAVPLNYPINGTYITFENECMHNITYFYTATDWLDNEITTEQKNLTIYVDEQPPEMGDMTVWGHYYYNESNPHPVNETIVINDSAGHIRAGAPFFIDATDTHMLRKVCIAQTEYNSDDTLQKGNNITSWPNDAQLFKATCDHINATKLYLFWDGAAKVTVVIHNGSYDGSNALGEASYDLTGSGSGWVEFTFSPGIQVEKGQFYYLEAFVGNDSNAVVRWAYSSVDKYEGSTCYGIISHQTYNNTRDWAFQIIANDPNPCDSGLEGIYYGYYYNGEWYPSSPGDGVVDIVEKYNYNLDDFYGHEYWYVYNSSTGVVFNEECQHDFYYWAKDNVCHHTPIYNHTFYVDATPPEVDMEMPSCYSMQEDVIGETIWHDSFENGIAGWTIAPLMGSDEWQVENSTYIDSMGWSDLTIDGDHALVYDDDGWYTPDARNASYAISPSIDCTGYDIVYLSFAAELEAFNGHGALYVNISNDNGATWHNVWLATDDEYGVYNINISSIAARHTILLNITYDDTVEQWGWGAMIDNITVYYPREHISCNAPMHLHAIDYPVTTGKIVDQEQLYYNSWDEIENVTQPPLYTAQSFIPTVNRLDAVDLGLTTVPGTINVSIYDSGLNLLAYNNTSIGFEDGWVQFHFDHTIPLIPGETYWIAVSASWDTQTYPSGAISWHWLNENPDPYPYGYMIRTGGIDISHDYQFKTEYYGDVEDTCAAGLEGMYYGYEYNGIWHPSSTSDNVTEHGNVINISLYYNDTEINNEFGGHYLWYVYNDSLGINFTQECQHELYYWAKDNVCHHTVVYHRTLYVDNSKPEITKTHPSHGYEVAHGIPYLREGANITLYADDMPSNACSSGTWLYWRYVWNNSGTLEYYPFFYHEGFEDGLPGWDTGQWDASYVNHSGMRSAMANGSTIYGLSSLISSSINLPDVPKITITFWQRADNLSYYDAANIFGIENGTGDFIPLKFFYKDDMSTDWQKVTVDLTPYAGQSVKLVWIYENDYGAGENWYIDDVNITGWYGEYGYDNVSVNISFNEECHHDLYYFAEDTTCHSTEIHHQEYYVDGTAPETDYTVITTGIRLPTYDNLVDYTICINDSINLTTNNTGHEPCIYPYTQTYYRWVWIDENGTKHYYPDDSIADAVNGTTLQPSNYADEIEPYYWLPYNGTFKFTEGCEHWLYFFSKDNLSNTEKPHNVSFGVDDEPPVSNLEFQGRYFTVDLNGYTATYINKNTIVWINATDEPNYPICSTGVNYTRYTIWKYNTVLHKWDVLIPWTDTNAPAQPGITIYVDNATTTARTIHIRINLTELMGGENYCGKYEIHWYSIDYNGWVEDEHYQDVIIDCSPPNATKEFSSPVVVGYLPGGEMIHWITNHTCIWINGSDDKDWDSGVGEIYYKFVNEEPVLLWQYNASDPYREPSACFVIDRPDGIYELYHWAVDRVGNVGDYNLTKQHVVLDDSAPSSCVEKITPYEQKYPPFNITVTNITDHGPLNNGVGVCKVELYYRYSIDNYTWSDWILYATNSSLITHEDGTADDWTLTFNNATRLGYYEFRSIAYDCLGNVEQKGDFNASCDAMCHVPDIMPPVSVKTYGSPVIELTPDIHAIRSDDTIWINITDMPDAYNASGVNRLMMSFDGTHYYTITSFDVIQPGSSGSYMVSYHFKPSDYGLGEGSYQMFFYAVDNEGNVEHETKQKFIVDDSAPETMITINGNETMPFDITIEANDTVGVSSMVLYYRYSEDGVNWGSWTPYAENDSIISSVIVVQNGDNITLIPNIQPWVVSFNMPVNPGYYKPGYYQFYVAATDNLNNSKATPTASTSPEASCYVPPWKEDLNADGRVNIVDMLRVLDHFGETGTPGFIPEDVHADGVIDIGDLIAIGHKWTG